MAILGVVWGTIKMVFAMLDRAEPEVIDQARSVAGKVSRVTGVTDLRAARWIGHRLQAEVNISVAPDLTVRAAHEIAKEVEHQLRHHLQFLSGAFIHVDPETDEEGIRPRQAPLTHADLERHAQ